MAVFHSFSLGGGGGRGGGGKRGDCYLSLTVGSGSIQTFIDIQRQHV